MAPSDRVASILCGSPKTRRERRQGPMTNSRLQLAGHRADLRPLTGVKGPMSLGTPLCADRREHRAACTPTCAARQAPPALHLDQGSWPSLLGALRTGGGPRGGVGWKETRGWWAPGRKGGLSAHIVSAQQCAQTVKFDRGRGSEAALCHWLMGTRVISLAWVASFRDRHTSLRSVGHGSILPDSLPLRNLLEAFFVLD